MNYFRALVMLTATLWLAASPAADAATADRTPPVVRWRADAPVPAGELDPAAPGWTVEVRDAGGLSGDPLFADLWLEEADGSHRLLDTVQIAFPPGASAAALPAFAPREAVVPGARLQVALYHRREEGTGPGVPRLDTATGRSYRYRQGPADAAGNATGPVIFRSFRAADYGVPRLVPQGNHILEIQNAVVGPNPFLPRAGNARIGFTLTRGAEVTITAYDWAGHFVDDVFSGFLAAGPQAVEWGGQTEDGRKLGNGVYLLRIAAVTQPRTEFEVLKVAVWNED